MTIATACGDSTPPSPVLESIAPSEAQATEATEVVVNGRNFHTRLVADLDTGETTEFDTFVVTLLLDGNVASSIELTQIARVETEVLTGIVPAGLEAGMYSAWVRGPYGDSPIAADVLEVIFTPNCDDPTNEGCPCDYLDSTHGVCAGGGTRDAAGECSVPPADYEDPESTCDGADNDCDGAVDEGCPCDYLDSTEGVCAGGGTIDDTGACSIPPSSYESPESSCADGADNNCNGLPDGQDPACGGINTPPVPAILVTPGAGDVSETYTADATGTWDREEAASTLLYEWDWENDGVFEASGSVVQKSDYAAGEHLVVLRVTDLGGLGLSAYATFLVHVAEPSNNYLLVVTTDQDHDDAETYPGPYNLGLSLREAIALANGQLLGTSVTIRFQDSYTILLTSPLPEPWNAAGVWIAGDGVTVDGAAIEAGECIRIMADNTRIFGLRMIDCAFGAVTFIGGTGTQVSRCVIERSGEPDFGRGAVMFSGPGTFGPDNVISEGAGNGVLVLSAGDGSLIAGNRIHGNAQVGIRTAVANTVTIRQNVIHGNGDGGIDISNSCDNCTITHNTIHGNTGTGLGISNNSNAMDFRNNILSDNTGVALDCSSSNFTGGFNDYNNYWGNADDCTCCGGSLPVNSPTNDPVYIDPASDGYLFRLMPSSTLIDAGVDTGTDLNGAEPGTYNGTSPDIGAWESPGP